MTRSLAEIVLASGTPRPVRGQGIRTGVLSMRLLLPRRSPELGEQTVPFGGMSGPMPGSFRVMENRFRRSVTACWAISVPLLLSACKSAPHDGSTPPQPPASLSPVPSPSIPTSTPTSTPTVSSTSPPKASAESVDASAPVCRVLRGPIEVSLRAPALLTPRADSMEAIFNEDGRPRIISHAALSPPLGPIPSGREPALGDKAVGLAVPCAVAGEHIFCPDRSGSIHRTTRGASEDRIVASSRPASRIAAVLFAETHVALAYLASRQTSEGWVSEAWLAVDDDRPVRVSEDGSGATALALAPRGSELLALLVDARTALTAMHARMIAYGAPVRVGEDAVVFVGGPGDRRTRAALATPASGAAWSFLPIARDVGSFGLAIVKLDEPPHVDEPVVWSMYPNGLDPAPIAAVSVAGGSAAWVARVRPQESPPSSPRVLELGRVAQDGAFVQGNVIPTTGNPTDVAVAIDRFGALWLAWVDGGGSWLERLSCR